jgi:hypothetical protein
LAAAWADGKRRWASAVKIYVILVLSGLDRPFYRDIILKQSLYKAVGFKIKAGTAAAPDLIALRHPSE